MALSPCSLAGNTIGVDVLHVGLVRQDLGETNQVEERQTGENVGPDTNSIGK